MRDGVGYPLLCPSDQDKSQRHSHNTPYGGVSWPLRKKKLEDNLRGLSNNRWGGHKSNRMRGFRGSNYGAASEVRHITITPELLAKYEEHYSSKQA